MIRLCIVHCKLRIMRILMLSWEYPPHLVGGLGSHVADLVPALAAQGAEVTLLTPRWKGGALVERVHENAIVYRVDPPVQEPSNYYADALQTNLTLQEFAHGLWEREGGFDVIHAHDWLVSFVAIALKKMFKTPLIATIHATERGRGGGHIHSEMSEMINGKDWWLTFEAWRVITTSHYMAQELRTFFELPPDKITIIPNGVDTRRFDALRHQDLRAFRAKWALPDERIVFSIGRMQYEKGFHLLVEAAHQILQRGERVKFILAGRGAMLNPLRQRVAELGLEKKILLPGYVSDEERDQLYCVADAAVFPSSYEPFGIVALEAMAAQCPVIVSNVGGLGEVVEHEHTGIKIPTYNADVLAEAIRYVLNDAAASHARASRAHHVVLRDFTWELIARETMSVYEHVVEARRHVKWE